MTITDASGCALEIEYQITEPALLVANASSTNETASNVNDGTAWATPTGGTPPFSYQWSNGSTDSLVTNLSPGSYNVIVTDINNCADTAIVIVESGPCTGTAITASVEPSCFLFCDGSASIVMQGGTGPYSYQWNTGDTTSQITGLCAGFYDVTITDEGQECITSVLIFVDEPNPLLTAVEEVVHVTDTTISAISIFVGGGTIPYSYSWTGPGGFTSTDEDLSDIPPGYYSVLITDGNGCTAEIDSIEVKDETVATSIVFIDKLNLYPNPAKDVVIIESDNMTLDNIQLQNLDGRMLRKWENETRLDISDIAPGLYVLQVRAANHLYVQKLIIGK